MSALVLASKPRRTQEERSATTRARLLDATIDCLSELGYTNTTTTEIAKRAGLSRGAQLHHFPTKAAWLELLVAARTDAELEPAVSAMAARFADTVQRTFHELFPDPATHGPFFDIAPSFAFALLQGLALDRISVKNDTGLQASLQLLKTLASWAITQRT
jgi:AcrR family transcriptional regulator